VPLQVSSLTIQRAEKLKKNGGIARIKDNGCVYQSILLVLA
jgi:hypothetical protein